MIARLLATTPVVPLLFRSFGIGLSKGWCYELEEEGQRQQERSRKWKQQQRTARSAERIFTPAETPRQTANPARLAPCGMRPGRGTLPGRPVLP